MRLWHAALIPYLPRQQLLGQHRECCALSGKGWGKPHATVNYVFKHHPVLLALYHVQVMQEMIFRQYNVCKSWFDLTYRGKNCTPYVFDDSWYNIQMTIVFNPIKQPIYHEYDDAYLRECLENLRNKGIILEGFDYDQERF